MHLNDHATSAAVRPANSADGGHQGWFSSAAPGGPGVPTVVTYDFMNSLQAELKHAIVDVAGLTLDKTDDTQLAQALQIIAAAAGASGALAPITTIGPTPGNPTTRISFSSGPQLDSTRTSVLVLPAPLSKRYDAVWAVGDTHGGRDQVGAFANGSTVHDFVIGGPGQPVDALASLSLTNPNLPAGYNKFRRVGSTVLDGSGLIRPFVQKPGRYFMYTGGPVVDYANQANGGGPNSRAITVPTGIKPYVGFHFQSTGTIDNNPYYSTILDPDDGTPPSWGTSAQRGQVRRIASQTPGAVQYSYETDEFWEFADRTAHILTFSSDGSDTIAVKTRGWRDDDLMAYL